MVTRAAPSVSLEIINLSRKATMGRKEEREMKFFLLSVSLLVNPSHALLFNVGGKYAHVKDGK